MSILAPKLLRIIRIEVRPYSHRMQRVVRTARGVFVDRTGWHVIVTRTDGLRGIGDAALWPGFGSNDAAACAKTLQALSLSYTGAPWPSRDAIDAGCAALPVEAACAWSTALWDIQAQSEGVRLGQALCADAAPEVAVHALVSNALEAQAAVAQGFRAIKVKVGLEPVSDEVTRIVALRAAVGSDIGLRLDANGAWPTTVALRAARLLAMVSPEWIEQPVAADDVPGMAEVRRWGGVAVAADESVQCEADLDAILAHNAADVIVVKPMFAGGLEAAVRLGRKAHKAGVDVIVTHALESAVGRMAALHVALALKCTRACGLGGDLPDSEPVLPIPVAGQMAAFARPGLGLTLTSLNEPGPAC